MHPILFEIPLNYYTVVIAGLVFWAGGAIRHRFAPAEKDASYLASFLGLNVQWDKPIAPWGKAIVNGIQSGAFAAVVALAAKYVGFRYFGGAHSIPLHIYGLMMASAFIVGIWLAMREAKHQQLPKVPYLDDKGRQYKDKDGHPVFLQASDVMSDLAFYLLIAGLGGARLLYIFTRWETDYRPDPMRIFMFWQGGLVWYGGLIGATLISWWFIRKHKIAFLPYGDAIVPGVSLAHAVGRLGCFAAGCCFRQHRVAELPAGSAVPRWQPRCGGTLGRFRRPQPHLAPGLSDADHGVAGRGVHLPHPAPRAQPQAVSRTGADDLLLPLPDPENGHGDVPRRRDPWFHSWPVAQRRTRDAAVDKSGRVARYGGRRPRDHHRAHPAEVARRIRPGPAGVALVGCAILAACGPAARSGKDAGEASDAGPVANGPKPAPYLRMDDGQIGMSHTDNLQGVVAENGPPGTIPSSLGTATPADELQLTIADGTTSDLYYTLPTGFSLPLFPMQQMTVVYTELAQSFGSSYGVQVSTLAGALKILAEDGEVGPALSLTDRLGFDFQLDTQQPTKTDPPSACGTKVHFPAIVSQGGVQRHLFPGRALPSA